MYILLNLDLLTVGIITAATGILGFMAYFSNPKSVTNKSFLIFCLLTIAWGALNYLSYQIRTPELAFWLLRISIFAAVWHAFFLFKLLYVFPQEDFLLPKSYRYSLLPLIVFSSFANLTPFTFHHIAELSSDGRIIKIANGPGIALFSFIIFSLIISGIIHFIRKVRSSAGVSAKQGRPVIIGVIITFAFILAFNLILPAFFNNSRYIPLGAFFFFPFIAGVSYSTFRHKFLDLKVVSTEILTFILALVILLEITTSRDVTTLIFRISIFMLVVCLGILLIKSVIREVQQRQELEKLTGELNDANEKLKALDQARAEFISIASHQLRTPPATVKWYLAAVLGGDYGKLEDETKDAVNKAFTTNNHLISLIEDMLNVSRIERGKMEFLFELTDVEELAKSAYEQLVPIAHDKKLELVYKAPEQSLPKIMADKEKLRQVMNNLIDNALKYTKQGLVSVSIFQQAGDIRFQVTDTGKGIPADQRASIFEKYTRGKESIKQSAGLGLGLYVAKIIIEQHKGKIWAESAGEGKGSTFLFSLPVHNNLTQTTLLDLTAKQ